MPRGVDGRECCAYYLRVLTQTNRPDTMLSLTAFDSLSERAGYTFLRLDGNTQISTRGMDDAVLTELLESGLVHFNRKLGLLCAKRSAYNAEALREDMVA